MQQKHRPVKYMIEMAYVDLIRKEKQPIYLIDPTNRRPMSDILINPRDWCDHLGDGQCGLANMYPTLHMLERSFPGTTVARGTKPAFMEGTGRCDGNFYLIRRRYAAGRAYYQHDAKPDCKLFVGQDPTTGVKMWVVGADSEAEDRMDLDREYRKRNRQYLRATQNARERRPACPPHNPAGPNPEPILPPYVNTSKDGFLTQPYHPTGELPDGTKAVNRDVSSASSSVQVGLHDQKVGFQSKNPATESAPHSERTDVASASSSFGSLKGAALQGLIDSLQADPRVMKALESLESKSRPTKTGESFLETSSEDLLADDGGTREKKPDHVVIWI